VFGFNQALRDTLPALETALAVMIGIFGFVALLAAGTVAAWSFALYFWLVESVSIPLAAVIVGFVLLLLSVIAVVAGRMAIRASFDGETPAARDQQHDSLGKAIEAIGDLAEKRPVPALLGALALGLAAGYFENGDRDQRPR